MTFNEARAAAFAVALPTSWQARMDAEARITRRAERYLAGKVKPEDISETVTRWLLNPDKPLFEVAMSKGNP